MYTDSCNENDSDCVIYKKKKKTRKNKRKRKRRKDRGNKNYRYSSGSSSMSDSDGPSPKKRRTRGRKKKGGYGSSSSDGPGAAKKLTHDSMWQQSLDLILCAHKHVINGDGAVAFADLIVSSPKKYDINVLPEEIMNNPKYRKAVKTAGFKPISTQHPAAYTPYPPNPYPQQSNYHGHHIQYNGGYQYAPSTGYHHGYNSGYSHGHNHNQYNGNYHNVAHDYDRSKYDDKRSVKESKKKSQDDKEVGVLSQPHEEYVSE